MLYRNKAMNDKFAALMAISTGEATAPLPAIWTHEINKPLIGTIKGFSRFQHDRYGMQETVIVELESSELVSAILTPLSNRRYASSKC
jgi:hypothetical protein